MLFKLTILLFNSDIIILFIESYYFLYNGTRIKSIIFLLMEYIIYIYMLDRIPLKRNLYEQYIICI